jgi:hypothetical protein
MKGEKGGGLLYALVLLDDFEHWSSFRMLIKLNKILAESV